MLDQTILAIRPTTAFPVAFEDVVACLEELLTKTPFVIAACYIWEYFPPTRSHSGVLKTLTVQVLTSDIPSILGGAVTAVVEFFRRTSSLWRTDMVVDESEV